MMEWFHSLRIAKGTKNFYYLSILNSIVTELEAIEVKIEDKYKVLRLLW